MSLSYAFSVLYPYLSSLIQPHLAHLQFVIFGLLLLNKLLCISIAVMSNVNNITRATKIVVVSVI